MKRKATEHILQTRCCTWFKYQFPHLQHLLFAVPNGGKRDKAEAGKLKAEGVKEGVADLILAIPSSTYYCLNIEMKAGSRQSEAQKIYQRYAECAGARYVICHSYEEFQKIIHEYLDDVPASIIRNARMLHAQIQKETVENAREQYLKLCKKTK